MSLQGNALIAQSGGPTIVINASLIGAVDAAQHANEYDMGGHAAHAKELLRQAREEIKMAARAANRH